MPLAAGLSKGALISEELGIVVIGGLVMSTVLTLIIVPVVYSLLKGFKKHEDEDISELVDRVIINASDEEKAAIKQLLGNIANSNLKELPTGSYDKNKDSIA